jgi:hypothetical protein
MVRPRPLLVLLGLASAGFSDCGGSSASSPQIMTVDECAAPGVALFGVNIDPGNPTANPSPDQLHELGVRWVRFVYRAGTGVAATRTQIERYRSAGIKVLISVNYEAVAVPKPAHDAPADQWTAYVAAFVQAAGEVATGIGSGVDAYEVWNEPDQLPEEGQDPACSCDLTPSHCDDDCGCDYQCYDPYVPTSYFGPMADQAGAVLAATGVPLVLGGFSSGQPSYVAATIAAGGGLTDYAGIGVHPYGADWIPGNSLVNVFSSYAFGRRQVWLTEIGLPVDGADGAEYLRHVYQTTLDGGFAGDAVPVIFWFAWSDGNRPGFGLVDVDGKPKATYTAYQELAPAAHGLCAGGGSGGGASSSCGDGTCAADETVETCAVDCGCAAPDACGSVAPFGCWCDAECGDRGDCCSDAASACGA